MNLDDPKKSTPIYQENPKRQYQESTTNVKKDTKFINFKQTPDQINQEIEKESRVHPQVKQKKQSKNQELVS